MSMKALTIFLMLTTTTWGQCLSEIQIINRLVEDKEDLLAEIKSLEEDIDILRRRINHIKDRQHDRWPKVIEVNNLYLEKPFAWSPKRVGDAQ